ncbi:MULTISPECIES: methionyl-tRNA formyltransferase [unclassified Agarivorans]|uniref:methionyl-tRNA formyltransferase n=2 Tax=Agarivorans TaxID=261825 RepID=UPI003D7D7BF3
MMMKQQYAIFTGSCFAFPTIQRLQQLDMLACVVLVNSPANPDLTQLQTLLAQHQIKALQYSLQSEIQLLAELDALQVSAGLVYWFRHKISPQVIQFFNGWLFNIHPGKLPDYRGPMPLYWQLRHGEKQLCLTLHRVAAEFDSGDIGMEQLVPIHPFDSLQCLYQKAAQYAPQLIERLLDAIQSDDICWQAQAQKDVTGAPKISEQDLVVDWHRHSSEDIVNMARAGNSDCGGVILPFPQGYFHLYQASKVNCELSGITVGTVLEVSIQAGMLIKTKDSALRLDIISCPQGFFDGYRFALLFGLDAGTCIDMALHRKNNV